jgi:imidazolonepropionase
VLLPRGTLRLPAAKALGLNDRGMIEADKRADLAVWNVVHPAELSYRIGANLLHLRLTGA